MLLVDPDRLTHCWLWVVTRQDLIQWLRQEISDQKRIDATTAGAAVFSDAPLHSNAKHAVSIVQPVLPITEKKQRKQVKNIFEDRGAFPSPFFLFSYTHSSSHSIRNRGRYQEDHHRRYADDRRGCAPGGIRRHGQVVWVVNRRGGVEDSMCGVSATALGLPAADPGSGAEEEGGGVSVYYVVCGAGREDAVAASCVIELFIIRWAFYLLCSHGILCTPMYKMINFFWIQCWIQHLYLRLVCRSPDIDCETPPMKGVPR